MHAIVVMFFALVISKLGSPQATDLCGIVEEATVSMDFGEVRVLNSQGNPTVLCNSASNCRQCR